MKEREMKSGWLRNWRAARDKERACCVGNDFSGARFWANVALGIELGFASFFNQSFGEFLVETLG